MNENARVLVSLGVAIAAGTAIGASGSASLQGAADAIGPVGTLWVNAIRMTVIPLVVSLLITGVASTSDVRAVGRLGKRILVVFFALLIATAAIVMPLAPLLFSVLPNDPSSRPTLPAGATEAASQLVSGGQAQTAGAWLVSLIPSNPVAAAANGAMLPLIIFTLLFALAVVRGKPEPRDTLVQFFGAIADAMLLLVRWVVLLAPVGVFALVLPLAVHAGAQLAGAIGFYIAAYSVGCVVIIMLLYPVVATFGHVPMRAYARALLPAQLIALSSSSSIASLPALVESADNLGLRKSVTGFVLPLTVSTFKIAGPVSWTMGALFVGWFYGVPLHARELATIAFAAVFLAFGVPGVPRGAFIMLTPLFQAIGLPIEGIGILIAVDAIPDTIATALNVSGYMAATTIVASGEGGE
ncbi:MAG: cation:dicarboxylase symporter family transporter [Gemmatimonas sp.]